MICGTNQNIQWRWRRLEKSSLHQCQVKIDYYLESITEIDRMVECETSFFIRSQSLISLNHWHKINTSDEVSFRFVPSGRKLLLSVNIINERVMQSNNQWKYSKFNERPMLQKWFDTDTTPIVARCYFKISAGKKWTNLLFRLRILFRLVENDFSSAEAFVQLDPLLKFLQSGWLPYKMKIISITMNI